MNLPVDPHSPTQSKTVSGFSEREKVANKLPFALRAWWMREHQESADLNFDGVDTVTAPIYRLHSDPVCDVGSMDIALP